MSNKRVLIVEDEAIVAADLRSKLRRFGYEVIGIAATGEDAVEMACRLDPQVVLMDIRLGGPMDGIEAAEKIRSRVDLPVIYLTAHSDGATLDRAKLTDPFGYILKPFEERDLGMQIELALYKHQADRKLREQREWLHVTLTSIGDAVIATDSAGCITFLNPVAESLTGWKSEEAEGLSLPSVFRIINEQTGHEMEEPVTRVLREGRPVPLANHAALVAKDGTTVPIEDSAAPILDAGGKVMGVVLVFHDVTEKRRAEEALEKSERQYRELVQNANSAIIRWKSDGSITFFNEYAQDFFGYREDEVTGRHVGILLPEAESNGRDLTTLVQDIVSHPERYAGNINENVCRDGRRVWMAWTNKPVFEGSGEVAEILAVGTDITGRKEMEDELQKRELRFKLLSDVAGGLLASKDPQAIVNELCRKVMEHLDCHAFFNFLVDERIGKLRLNACAGIPEEEAKKIEWLDFGVAVCGCAALERKRIIAEDIFHTPDIHTELVKSYGIQAYACHPLMVQDKLIGTLSFGTRTRPRFSEEDIALMKTVADHVSSAMERMGLIEELRKSRDELEHRVQERTAELESTMGKLQESNQALQDFASIASHDLQEPLRKVTTFGNMLEQRYGDALGDGGKEYLKRMLSATDRMLSLLRALLDYSRLATKAEPFRPVDLRTIVREVLADLEVRIESTGGEVQVGDLPAIEADPNQMRQLFQNLIGNGLKFHRSGRNPVVKVYCSNPEACTITIEDNGIGFDEAYLEKIFAPFQRLHGKSSRYEGTGMGLAICRKIAERHGGSITATSIPGEGSTFRVTLPLKQSDKSSGLMSLHKEETT